MRRNRGGARPPRRRPAARRRPGARPPPRTARRAARGGPRRTAAATRSRPASTPPPEPPARAATTAARSPAERRDEGHGQARAHLTAGSRRPRGGASETRCASVRPVRPVRPVRLMRPVPGCSRFWNRSTTANVTGGVYRRHSSCHLPPPPPMSIVLEHLTKRYAGHPVVNGVSLQAGEGELYVLLGPSGSGKSTLLRMIAGLADVDAGRVLLHGRDVTDLPPARRGVGFVFQSYALFRGMTAAENVEFALRIRGVKAAERRRRRDELLEMVGLTGLGGRTPRQLSGGQQQRVALARALAHQPEVLLLDEPFGALDARVRLELRRTVRTIQRELRITTLFVTHDQEEAFELADRVAVMNFGRLLEEGPPEELYLRPSTEFVATFLGTANLMVGECAGDGVRLRPVRFPLATSGGETAGAPRRVPAHVRPEDVALRDQPPFVASYGPRRLRLPPLPGVRPIAPAVPFGSDEILIEATRPQTEARAHKLQAGDKAWVGVPRVPALVHPGLRLLLLADGTPASQAAVALGGQLARLAHARVTVLGHHPAWSGRTSVRF